MLSERGKKLLILNNYTFYKLRHVKSTGEVCWRCTYRTCSVKLFTVGDDDFVTKIKGEHNHESAEKHVLSRKVISNSVKRKANEQLLCEKPSKLIHLELTANSEATTKLTSTDIRYIKNNLNQAKLKMCPKLPKSTEEVHQYIDSVSINTVQNENFILINNKFLNIIVFSCDTNLQFLCAQSTLYVDGTFDYCTKHFLQLFTIFGFQNDIYVPLVFCVLKNKQTETYSNLFRLLKYKCAEKGLALKPSSIVMDFEIAIHISAREIFPDVHILGCRFHLTQAW